MTAPVRVLLVDDDADVRMALGQALELADYAVTACKCFIEATDHLSPGFAGVVVTDVRMPGKDGLALLERSRRIDPDLPVIVLTGEGDVPMAVQAMGEGAFDFIEKPCPPRHLVSRIEAAWVVRAKVLEGRRHAAHNSIAATVADQPAASLAAQMDAVERLLIEASLRDHRGLVVAVADALALPRKTLYDKLRRHNINPADFRSRDG